MIRWIPFLLFAYVLVLVQTTVGQILTIDRFSVGPFGPDLLIPLAVFVAFYAKDVYDAMLCGWAIGMLIDLTTAGGGGAPTRVGPMALILSLSMWVAFNAREWLYREKVMPQMVVGGLLCFTAHFLWCVCQIFFAGRGWDLFGGLCVQSLLSSVYTALLTPLAFTILWLCRKWLFLTGTSSRSRRSR